MKKKEINDLVMGKILELYDTVKVNRCLAPEASLIEDLGLSGHEIYLLGLAVDAEVKIISGEGITDSEITSWVTVRDIMKTVKNALWRRTAKVISLVTNILILAAFGLILYMRKGVQEKDGIVPDFVVIGSAVFVGYSLCKMAMVAKRRPRTIRRQHSIRYKPE